MMKILVIQNKRIGDVLISSVIANNMKKLFPDSEITYFVYDYTVGVLEGNPNIDRIISVNEKKLKEIPHLIKTIRKIRKEKYNIIFDPYSKFQSRVICLFSNAEYTIGNKREHKKLPKLFYTHAIDLLKNKSKDCGKAIEDRIHLITSVFSLNNPDYIPKILLSEEEKNYDKLNTISKPVILIGILGSTPKKSMPYEYMVEIIDYISENYEGSILFNYAPHQRNEALKIFEACLNKDKIHLDIYEESIRGFIQLMNKSDLLISNEGGSVHIAKALARPSFTIYSPYINKDAWGSFEASEMHDSIHLLEEKPELYDKFHLKDRRKIESDPEYLYKELKPEIILSKLKPFLDFHLAAYLKKAN